jgi:hypothetical protein
MILDIASSHVVSSAKVGEFRGFFNLEFEQHDFGIPSSQCYSCSSTFASRYNSIFQNTVEEETFCSGFYCSMMMLQ